MTRESKVELAPVSPGLTGDWTHIPSRGDALRPVLEVELARPRGQNSDTSSGPVTDSAGLRQPPGLQSRLTDVTT